MTSSPARQGRLATEALLHSRGVFSASPQLREHPQAPRLPEAHRGHGCCLDASRARARRYALVASRPVLQGSSPTLLGRGQGLGRAREVAVLPAVCKSYGCPCCQTRNVRRNRKRALMGARPSRGVVALLTATLDPEHPMYREAVTWRVLEAGGYYTKDGTLRRGRYSSADEAALSVRYIARAWNAWVTEARRLEPSWLCDCRRVTRAGARARRHEKGCTVRNRPLADLAFFKGLELQRNGRAHVHVILRLHDLAELLAIQAQLRAIADRVGLGGRRKWRDGQGRLRSGFEIERARSRRELASYVTKAAGSWYGGQLAAEVAKPGQARSLPAYARRASWSMGRRAWAPDWVTYRRTDLDWTFARASAETVTRALEASGVLVDPDLFRGAVPARGPGLEVVA